MRRPSNKTVIRYLLELARGSGLAGWRIDIAEEPAAAEHWVSVSVERSQAVATLSLNADLFDQPPADQRHYLVHELVHVHLAPLDWSFEDAALSLGVRARRFAEGTWDQRSERACDDIARLLSPRLPLPPWGVR